MTHTMQYAFIFLLIIVCASKLRCTYVNTITEYGRLSGLSKTLEDGRPYDVYLGVPYAAPPVGSLRWQKPQPPKKAFWRRADKYAPYCKQIITPLYGFIPGIGKIDSEDCLYLNIFIPRKTTSKSLPVLFFVFGGAFFLGNSDVYPGEDLAVNGEVIVVTYNYRVATMGFLSSGSKTMPGNYGLWDGKAALEWVKRNIANFGGDPDLVTIFGQSAGGASVSHMSLSNSFNGLFKRVIEMSGSATSYFGTTSSSNSAFKDLSLATLCFRFTDSSRRKCLENITATKLDNRFLAGIFLHGRRMPNLLPVVDNDLILNTPDSSLNLGISAKYDLMTGFCEMDAALLVYVNPLGLHFGGLLTLTKTKSSTMLFLKAVLSPYENSELLLNMILKMYPNIKSTDFAMRTKAVVTMATDFIFGSPAIFEASRHSQLSSKNTFVYEYSYRHSFMQYQPEITASHLDDLNSVFGDQYFKSLNDLLGRSFSERDKLVSLNYQRYYANFAYTGNPNHGPHKVDMIWPQYDVSGHKLLNIDSNMTEKMLKKDKLEKYRFWNEDFKKAKIIRNPDYSTWSSNFNETEIFDFKINILTDIFRNLTLLSEKMKNSTHFGNLIKEIETIIVKAMPMFFHKADLMTF